MSTSNLQPHAPASSSPADPWPWPPDYVPTLDEVAAVCPEYAAAVRWLIEQIVRREAGLLPEDRITA